VIPKTNNNLNTLLPLLLKQELLIFYKGKKKELKIRPDKSCGKVKRTKADRAIPTQTEEKEKNKRVLKPIISSKLHP